MCGVVGTVSTAPVDPSSTRQMLDALAHRGPDGRGIAEIDDGRAVFGHARLAIIDPTDGGTQPMADASQRLWITYNGEIYNFRQLRRTLQQAGHTFRSESDTEVLLVGYREWSYDIVRRLDGIFAFAIWDSERRELFVARDQLGIKPLYYSTHGSTFRFASEAKALVTDEARPNHDAIRDFLTFGYVPWDRSAFDGVHKLPPGHTLVWQDGAIRSIRRYWQASLTSASRTESQLVEDVRASLARSVEGQMISDVPVGVVVSGGVDSSAVAGLMPEPTTRDAFTIGFADPDQDERSYARTMCHSVGLRHHERELGEASLLGLLHDAVETFDEPFADTSAMPTLGLFAFVAEHRLKVVLSGDGGDELFAGYRRYRRLVERTGYSAMRGPLRALFADRPADAMSMLRNVRTSARSAWDLYFSSLRVFDFTAQQDLLAPAYRPREDRELGWLRTVCWNDEASPLAAAQYFDLCTYLPEDILAKVDRASMRHGVEARVPLLDTSLVSTALAIPSRMQLRGGTTKHLLKQAVAPFVPSTLLDNRKKGFGIRVDRLLGDVLARFAERSRSVSRLVEDGVVAPGALTSTRSWSAGQLWNVFCLELWWRRWIRHEARPGDALLAQLGPS